MQEDRPVFLGRQLLLLGDPSRKLRDGSYGIGIAVERMELWERARVDCVGLGQGWIGLQHMARGWDGMESRESLFPQPKDPAHPLPPPPAEGSGHGDLLAPSSPNVEAPRPAGAMQPFFTSAPFWRGPDTADGIRCHCLVDEL